MTPHGARPVAAKPRLWRARWVVHRFVNPVTRMFAGWVPWFAILTHVGRRSGRSYQIRINAFRRGDHYGDHCVFALTYGSAYATDGRKTPPLELTEPLQIGCAMTCG